MSNNSIIRMTTPSITFLTDVDFTHAQKISVTFRQYSNSIQNYVGYCGEPKEILILNESDLTIDQNNISHIFTQQETQKFKKGDIEIQIKALMEDGNVIANDPPIKTEVKEIFDERIF